MSCGFYISVVLFALLVNGYFVGADDILEPVEDMFSRRSSSHAVECYTCDNCPRTSEQTPRTFCPPAADQAQSNKCIVYTERYFSVGAQASWVTRGCASTKGSCEIIRKSYNNSAYNQLEFCRECEGDRCNGAGLPRLTFAFFAVVLAPLLGIHILS